MLYKRPRAKLTVATTTAVIYFDEIHGAQDKKIKFLWPRSAIDLFNKP
jgi:hypothetical protein